MAIYMRLEQGQKFESLRHLLHYGFTQSPNSGKFVETFSNKECTIFQCKVARRSLEDLIEIAQVHFPEVTDSDVAKTLFSLYADIKVRPLYCFDISKIVFNIAISDSFDYMFSGFNKTLMFERGCGKYSFNDIMNLINT